MRLLPCIKPSLIILQSYVSFIYFVHGNSAPLPPQLLSVLLVQFLLALSLNYKFCPFQLISSLWPFSEQETSMKFLRGWTHSNSNNNLSTCYFFQIFSGNNIMLACKILSLSWNWMYSSLSLLSFDSLEMVISKTIQNNIDLTDFSKATLCALIFRLFACPSCVPHFPLFFSIIANFLCSLNFTNTF